MNQKVWLIGAGEMSVDYVKVLPGLQVDFEVIGRSKENAKIFKEKTDLSVIIGGLENYLNQRPEIPEAAIVSVGVEQLAPVTTKLLDYGIKKILVEKPGGLNEREIGALAEKSTKLGSEVLVAYNRRFYSSVLKAQEIIQEDEGITSFNFEFTEWSHIIENIEKAKGVKDIWFLANSTHVVDLAFFLGGAPKELQCYTSGQLDWHPTASIFAGSGISETGALFSYQANWGAPGRWSVEMLTRKHRLILRPMEKLQIQEIGSVATEFVEIDDKLDQEYKPGLYLQVKHFLEGGSSAFCSIQDQLKMSKFYNKIANY